MEGHLAASAQAARVPYVLATPACEAIERIAAIAPDVFWFQTYAAPDDDFRITFDMLRRAERAGARALLVTIDSPVRAKRPKDMRNRLAVPFKPNLRTILDVAGCPRWLLEVVRRGTPRAENFVAYMPPRPTSSAVARFVQGKIRGGYTWETIRRLRDVWSGPLVVKGVLHPQDAEMAVRVGADGVLVSNHGGRTFDAAPPAITMLPKVKAVVGNLTVLLDSGARSGLDIVRGLALGAQSVFAGRPFLYAVGALGSRGGDHVLDLLIEETRVAMGQIGARDLEAVGNADFFTNEQP
jgi:L-lactate dehydrogenase (cytochrome)